jgi:PAS domain-containing protein
MSSNETLFSVTNQNITDCQQCGLAEALSNIRQIQNELNEIRDAYQKLAMQYESLQKAYAVRSQNAGAAPCQSDAAYELFRSFVDGNDQKIILIDTSYTICYMNRLAATHLRLSKSHIVTGRRIFDFFAHKDALKIKKKTDAAFFSGEKEKIKDVTFRYPQNDAVQIDLKLMRVRYRNRPSIEITIQ